MRMKIKERIGRRLQGARNGAVADEGPALERIDTLTAANREQPDGSRESRLVVARNEAFRELRREAPADAPEMRAEMPPEARSAYEVIDGLPTIDATGLSAEAIRAAFLEAGALLVRGLLPAARAGELARGIDEAFAGRDAHLDGTPIRKTKPWFEPFTPAPEWRTTGKEWNRHVRGGGSVWVADSPRMMFRLLEAFDEAGLRELVADYLGERPVLSMKKSVLRRVEPGGGTSWHQDGAFLGDGLRTLNVWIALNRCGDVAPGLDVVPRRLTEIVPTGTEGAMFDWSVSDRLVAELVGDMPIPSPTFDPGDALLFDHLCLHRTAMKPGMSEPRYATETWCFAGSTYPDQQIPLVA